MTGTRLRQRADRLTLEEVLLLRGLYPVPSQQNVEVTVYTTTVPRSEYAALLSGSAGGMLLDSATVETTDVIATAVQEVRGATAAVADPAQWLAENIEELRQRFGGQWVAVVGTEVRAAEDSFGELLATITALGLEDPFVTEIQAQPTTWDSALSHG